MLDSDGGWLTTACVWLGSYIALCLLALCLTVGLFYLAEVCVHTARGTPKESPVPAWRPKQRPPARVPTARDPPTLSHAPLLSPVQLVEEHHKLVKRVLFYLVRVQLGLHVALALLDTQPLGCVACGFAAHVCYAALLPRYPGYRVLSPEFLGAVALCVASHALWINHFYYHTYASIEFVGAFFVVTLWPTPFLLFLSFGAIDGLPVAGLGGAGAAAGDKSRDRPGNGLLAALGFAAKDRPERLGEQSHVAEQLHNGDSVHMPYQHHSGLYHR